MKTKFTLPLITALIAAAVTARAGLTGDTLGVTQGTPADQGLTTDPLGMKNGTLQYLAAPGAVNTVTLAVQNNRLILRDTTAPLPPANIPGMQRPNANTISLPAAAVLRVRVVLGDQNDSLHAAGLTIPLHIAGGNGNDTIVGGDGSDFLQGDDGDDTLWGGGGTDEICGGNGNDSLTGDAGDDIIHGNDGNDAIAGGNGNDTLDGDDGLDDLWGDAGTDNICGGNGNDSLTGDAGDAELTGDAGDDFITVVSTNLCGGADDDQIMLPPVQGGAGHDTLALEGRAISAAQEAALTQSLGSTGLEILEIAGH